MPPNSVDNPIDVPIRSPDIYAEQPTAMAMAIIQIEANFNNGCLNCSAIACPKSFWQ